MFCGNCGNQLEVKALFCPSCGNKVGNVQGPTRSATSSHAPGRGFLKVTGILYIIMGALNAISALILMDTASAVAGFGRAFGMPGVGITAGGIRMLAIISLLYAIWQAIVGIMGIKHCEDISQAGLLRNLVTVDIIGGVILLLIMTYAITFSWLSLIFFVVPVCYLIGALKNQGAIG